MPTRRSGSTSSRCVRCAALLAPRCGRCRGRHLPALPCWTNRAYRDRLWAQVLAAYGTTCCHCRREGSASIEHLQPRSHYGNDDLANLRPAHLLCGQRRACKPIPGLTPPATPTTSRAW